MRFCCGVVLAIGMVFFKKITFVHKSIEKTQKFKYFWAFLSDLCSMNCDINLHLGAWLWSASEQPPPKPRHGQAV
jgi:hypothetical protein